jgi:uroporphyrinogen decarboxylase
MKPLLVRHLEGQTEGRFPVWMMRQAGRYLDSYRNLRSQHSFWEMVSTPQLAAQVSLLPVHELPVDAVIFFSDILTLPYGLGIPVEMKESIGPFLENPLRSLKDFEVFETFSAKKHTPYISKALQLIKQQIPQ